MIEPLVELPVKVLQRHTEERGGKMTYMSPELLNCRPIDLYTSEPRESFRNWFESEGDIDDFIFFDEGEKNCSEK